MIGLSCDMDPSGQGYSALFHNDQNSLDLLNDLRSWGTHTVYPWMTKTWYNMKFRVINPDLNDGKVKVWQSSSNEPTSWTVDGNFGGGSTRGYGMVGVDGSRQADITYFDDFQVRYIIDPEPSTSLGQEETRAVLKINPSTVQTSSGQTFSMNITVSNASDLYLWVCSISWDPSLLEFVNITEGNFLGSGGNTSGILIGQINQTGGYLKEAACSLMGNVPGVDGEGCLATLFFKSNDNVAGISDVDIYFSDLVNSNGQSIPCSISNGIVEVGGDLSILSVDIPYAELPKYANMTIPLNVTIGWTGKVDAGAFNVSFAAHWNDGGIIEHYEKIRVENIAANSNMTLNFSFTPSRTGNYTLTFTVDCDNDIPELNEANNIFTLSVAVRVQGDMNGDNTVDYRDLFILAKAYWSTPLDPNWNPSADLNYDGVVNYRDLFILSENYS